MEEAFDNSQIKYNFNEGYISLRKAEKGLINQDKRKISGTVKDATGTPVIGANVVVKGTTIGNVTDIDGRFSLEIPENATLTISYIGYLTQEIAVGNRSDLSIQLKEDSETLDEVVVIGYGTTSAKKMVSAVTAVKGEKLQDLPFPNVASTLQDGPQVLSFRTREENQVANLKYPSVAAAIRYMLLTA